jgi:hypothetical protein
MYVVIEGTLQDGFWFYGPFLEEDDALQFGEEHCGPDWNIQDLTDPVEFEDEVEEKDEELLEAEPVDLDAVCGHKWDRGIFLGQGGLEVRHCSECPATEAKNSLDQWERIA